MVLQCLLSFSLDREPLFPLDTELPSYTTEFPSFLCSNVQSQDEVPHQQVSTLAVLWDHPADLKNYSCLPGSHLQETLIQPAWDVAQAVGCKFPRCVQHIAKAENHSPGWEAAALERRGIMEEKGHTWKRQKSEPDKAWVPDEEVELLINPGDSFMWETHKLQSDASSVVCGTSVTCRQNPKWLHCSPSLIPLF